MLRVKEDKIKELEKYGFMNWDKEGAEVIYFKFVFMNSIIIQIMKDRRIEFQLCIGSIIKEEDIKIENYIEDLITAGIVVKE